MSRSGRNVRFEIPEVPPPPSTPQGSEKDLNVEGEENPQEPSKDTAPAQTTEPNDTPLVQIETETTIRTDMTTFNSSEPKEPTFVKKTVSRERSMVSTPEPWPSVNEADFDVTPAKALEERFHVSNGNKVPIVVETGKGEADDDNRDVSDDTAGVKPESPGSDFINRTTEPSENPKKLREGSPKSASPAPPPPSPEPKDEEARKPSRSYSGRMLPVPEEGEETQASMTVLQISPKGVNQKPSNQQRTLDTFVNIDIPADLRKKEEPSPVDVEEEEEEEEGRREEVEDDVSLLSKELKHVDSKTRNTALSVQSTLAAPSISNSIQSQGSSSVVEPAMSQASLGPALSEDLSEKPDMGGVVDNWDGVSDSRQKEGQEGEENELPEMSEDGGDHEGFKADLKREYEKLMRSSEKNLENLESENQENSDSQQ